MTEIDLAWVAGIIDGEGSIFVMRQQRKDRDRSVNYILRVSVQSTDPYMATELKKLFPEGAVFGVQRDKRPECSDTLKWQLNCTKSLDFLKQIRPYLRVKHEQADIAIEFQETTKKHWKHMTEEDYKKQESLYQKLKQAKTDLKLGKIERN